MRRYKRLKLGEWTGVRFSEEIRLTDLMKHSGMSNFTAKFRKTRNELHGSENITAKVVRLRVNKKRNIVTFIFRTKPTYDTAQKTDPKSGFNLSSTKSYVMMVQILDFFRWAETKPGYKKYQITPQEIKEILMVANIKVFCNCPSFHWQGDNYNLSMFDGSIYPTNIPPNHWRKYHHDDNLLCKHLSGFLAQMKFYLNPMTSMMNKYLKQQKED